MLVVFAIIPIGSNNTAQVCLDLGTLQRHCKEGYKLQRGFEYLFLPQNMQGNASYSSWDRFYIPSSK